MKPSKKKIKYLGSSRSLFRGGGGGGGSSSRFGHFRSGLRYGNWCSLDCLLNIFSLGLKQTK